jgi:hypothetical protein
VHSPRPEARRVAQAGADWLSTGSLHPITRPPLAGFDALPTPVRPSAPPLPAVASPTPTR